MAAAVHSWVRIEGGSCGCPNAANATMAANSARRISHRRAAPAPIQMSFRIFCVVANAALVAVVVGPFSPPIVLVDGLVALGVVGFGCGVTVVGVEGVGASVERGAGGSWVSSSAVSSTMVEMTEIQTGSLPPFAESIVTVIGRLSRTDVVSMSA